MSDFFQGFDKHDKPAHPFDGLPYNQDATDDDVDGDEFCPACEADLDVIDAHLATLSPLSEEMVRQAVEVVTLHPLGDLQLEILVASTARFELAARLLGMIPEDQRDLADDYLGALVALVHGTVLAHGVLLEKFGEEGQG